jgi:hypothetical protein
MRKMRGMSLYDKWSLGVSIVAFGAGLWQLFMLSRTTRQDHDRRRKQATMEYLAANMDRRKVFFAEGIPNERDPARIMAKINESLSGDQASTDLITAYLTTFNFLAVGAQTDAFDTEVIDEAWGGLIIAVWNHYRPWIEAQRSRYGEPRNWENLEWLAARIPQHPRLRTIPTGPPAPRFRRRLAGHGDPGA